MIGNRLCEGMYDRGVSEKLNKSQKIGYSEGSELGKLQNNTVTSDFEAKEGLEKKMP